MEGVDGFSLHSTLFVLSDALIHCNIHRFQLDLLPLGSLSKLVFNPRRVQIKNAWSVSAICTGRRCESRRHRRRLLDLQVHERLASIRLPPPPPSRRDSAACYDTRWYLHIHLLTFWIPSLLAALRCPPHPHSSWWNTHGFAGAKWPWLKRVRVFGRGEERGGGSTPTVSSGVGGFWGQRGRQGVGMPEPDRVSDSPWQRLPSGRRGSHVTQSHTCTDTHAHTPKRKRARGRERGKKRVYTPHFPSQESLIKWDCWLDGVGTDLWKHFVCLFWIGVLMPTNAGWVSIFIFRWHHRRVFQRKKNKKNLLF